MPSGAELSHAARLLADGSPGAVAGLIIGGILLYPGDCELSSGSSEVCSNIVGQHYLGGGGHPVLDEAWFGHLAGCVVVGAVLGWLLMTAIRAGRAG
jgi:hypothetical protein